jgi:hypothetical protein
VKTKPSVKQKAPKQPVPVEENHEESEDSEESETEVTVIKTEPNGPGEEKEEEDSALDEEEEALSRQLQGHANKKAKKKGKHKPIDGGLKSNDRCSHRPNLSSGNFGDF